MEQIKLTQYSHGAGCGCKISPKVLSDILMSNQDIAKDPRLLIGNDTKDDAAVYQLDDDRVVISTTDFFMPIVDDPFDFGSIASVNAISDIYAMGGKPLMAISILGWPVDKLSSEVAREVLEGARHACQRAGIPVAGGHSIDTPEPIFGLAVTGHALKDEIKTNDAALTGDKLYLTKPLGIGIMTTAQKKGILSKGDLQKVKDIMLSLNDIGSQLGKVKGVSAMTDVTGFGLLGHLTEICLGSNVSARIEYQKVPKIDGIEQYMAQRTFPGGTTRNFDSYGQHIGPITDQQKALLCDPQTSGGLLIAVQPEAESILLSTFEQYGIAAASIGKIVERTHPRVSVL